MLTWWRQTREATRLEYMLPTLLRYNEPVLEYEDQQSRIYRAGVKRRMMTGEAPAEPLVRRMVR